MIDLGLSEHYSSTGDGDDGHCPAAETPIGTIAYMSPEMLLAKSYDRRCDIWSLGVILWAILVGEPLFTHECDSLCKEQILNPDFLAAEMKKLVGKISPEARDLLSLMLQRDPDKRISAAEALKHKFIMKSYSPSDYSDMGSSGGPALFDRNIVQKMDNYARMPALKRVGLYIFAHLCGTDGDDMRLYRVTFRQLDRTGTGALTAEEMTTAIKHKGLSVPEDFQSRVMMALDSDRSDSIDFLEFLAATIEIKASPKHEKILRGVFQLMDTTRRGSISKEDMAEIFTGNSPDQLEDMINEVAPSGKLDWDQFKTLMMSKDVFSAEY